MHDPESSLPAALNQIALDCICEVEMPVPLSARVLATMHTAMYDAWTLYQSEAQPYRLGGVMRRPSEEHTEENQAATIKYAANRVLQYFFYDALQETNNKTLIYDAMQLLGVDPTDASLEIDTHTGIGNLAAQAILDFRAGDGANRHNTLGGDTPYQDYTGYEPGIGPGDVPQDEQKTRWQPLYVPQRDNLPVMVQAFAVPHWGLLVPFALRNGWSVRNHVGPEEHYSPRFREQCVELIEISAGLTDQQKAIAEYWDDGPEQVTTAGHWCIIAAEVSRRNEHSLGDDVRFFFGLTNTLFDASIGCWHSKRHHDYVRPVTAIRHLFNGETIEAWGGPDYGGVRQMDGKDWHPYQPKYFVTPAHPEYPSVHSTLGAAAAQYFELFTGGDAFTYQTVIEACSSRLEAGVPDEPVHLEWHTFSEMARQAGQSRLYAGVHFEDANIDGLDMGEKVAQKVWDKCELLWKSWY